MTSDNIKPESSQTTQASVRADQSTSPEQAGLKKLESWLGERLAQLEERFAAFSTHNSRRKSLGR